MLVASFDLATSSFDWLNEHPNWGYSAAIVYKNYGLAQTNLFIGGAMDLFDESSIKKEWYPAIVRLHEDGTAPLTSSDTWFKFGSF